MYDAGVSGPWTSDIALEERLDFQGPLRHLMQIHDDGGVVSADGPPSQLLNVLPQQHPSVEDGGLKLSFFHQWHNLPSPLSIVLRVDASPGCGGLADCAEADLLGQQTSSI